MQEADLFIVQLRWLGCKEIDSVMLGWHVDVHDENVLFNAEPVRQMQVQAFREFSARIVR